METSKNRLTDQQTQFINSMKLFLDTKLYFYGSINRTDYFPDHSDIDIDIFTHDVNGMVLKLKQYLNLETQDFKHFVYRLITKNNFIASGVKTAYNNLEKNIRLEISIYNNKFKQNILEEHNRKTNFPFIISNSLFFIKYIHYILPLLPRTLYSKLKSFLMHECMGERTGDFLVTDVTKEEAFKHFISE